MFNLVGDPSQSAKTTWHLKWKSEYIGYRETKYFQNLKLRGKIFSLEVVVIGDQGALVIK